MLLSTTGLPLATGEPSGDCFFFSAVRTLERAATAAALCDPWPLGDFLGVTTLVPVDELKAEFKAAKASALCLGPPWFKLFNLSCISKSKKY